MVYVFFRWGRLYLLVLLKSLVGHASGDGWSLARKILCPMGKNNTAYNICPMRVVIPTRGWNLDVSGGVYMRQLIRLRCTLVPPKDRVQSNLESIKKMDDHHVQMDERYEDVVAPGERLENQLSEEYPEVLALLKIKQQCPARALRILQNLFVRLKSMRPEERTIGDVNRYHRIEGIRALALLEMQEIEEALLSAQAQVDLKPNHPAGFSNKGWILGHTQDLEGAMNWQRKAIALSESYAPAHYRLSLVLRDLRRFDEALSEADEALHYDPLHYDALIHKASIHLEMGHLDTTKDTLMEAMKLDAARAESYAELGNLFYICGAYEQATLCLKEALRRNPDCCDALTYMGNILAMTKHLDKALESYENALAINPKSTKALLSKAAALGQTGAYDDAIRVVDFVIGLYPNNSHAYFIKGQSLLKKVDYMAAVKVLEKAVEIDRYFRRAYIALFQVYRKLGENSKLLELTERALGYIANFDDAYYSRGLSQLLLRQLDASIESFNQVLHINPKHPSASLALVAACIRSERYEQGLEIVRALPSGHYDYLAHFAHASLLCGQQYFSQALEYVNLAIKSNSSHLDSHLLKARLLVRLGRYDEALDCHDKAIELKPRLGSLYILKGNTYLECGRIEEAFECYDLAGKRESLTVPLALKAKVAAAKKFGREEDMAEWQEQLDKLSVGHSDNGPMGHVDIAGFSEIM